MARASDIGVFIGVKDIHGGEIRNGDRIRVQHVSYEGTKSESIDEEFNARVFYHDFIAAFLYTREGVSPEDEDANTYHFNHRSSRYEILGDN